MENFDNVTENAKVSECIKRIVAFNGELDLDVFARYIVGECILAILAAKVKPLGNTTYDYNLMDAVTSKIIDSVREHWDFQNV